MRIVIGRQVTVSMTQETITLHGFVSGRVQGVFFRAATQRQAQTLGVRGWVRNCRDGRVELLIHGPAQAIGHLRLWPASGPPMAAVQDLQLKSLSEEELPQIPPGFEITG